MLEYIVEVANSILKEPSAALRGPRWRPLATIRTDWIWIKEIIRLLGVDNPEAHDIIAI